MTFRIADINTGHCQITYAAKNQSGERIYYCLQDNGELHGGVRFLRCTQDGEPSHEVKAPRVPRDEFEAPLGDSPLEVKCRTWIVENLPLEVLA